MKDYGFNRCCSAKETEGLLCVCSSLVDTCGVRSHVLHKWVAKGDKKVVEEPSSSWSIPMSSRPDTSHFSTTTARY
ncbi:hypothetical protein CSHISOI_06488 [Colletotrichum shisoi]|uniref:Uncharacterized protein n=1 Tax=Colletotrichum shisoi TaxID=2078593 RepID=A0A5Q4BR00_9PEZI|nr:hypothetical protein CSHISOI_06488 [Colletotrichum shisoi]